jgi:hypothetical protein
MATIISTKTSGVGGLSVTGDASGVLQLASANGTTAVTIDASGQQSSTIVGYGTYNEYKCRAWVNFNGTGTVAIRASGNVSSITDNGVGAYTVNFTTAMPDINYSVSSQGGIVTTVGPAIGVIQPFYSTGTTREAPLVGSFKISCENFAGTMFDSIDVCLAIFR